MKIKSFKSKNQMSRREFLRIPRVNGRFNIILNKERCTGCGLCAINCPTKALILYKEFGKDSYKILFRNEMCNGCGICEKSCPADCIKLLEHESDKKNIESKTELLFHDEIIKCRECKTPIFPQAMIKKLESKVFVNKEMASIFHLCPACRTKSHFIFSKITSEGGLWVG